MKTPPIIRKILTLLLTTYFRYVAAAVVLFIFFLGYALLFSPQLQLVRRVGILAYRTEAERLEDRSRYLEQAKSMVEAYREATAARSVKSEDILPTQPAISELFLMLQSLVRQSGMTLESIIVSKGSGLATGTSAPADQPKKGTSAEAKSKVASGGGTVQILDVSLGVSGPQDYESYKRFLANFERSQRLIDIMSVSFSPPAKEEKAGAAPVAAATTFDLKMYYLETATPS